jgi:PEP-CTERM motif
MGKYVHVSGTLAEAMMKWAATAVLALGTLAPCARADTVTSALFVVNSGSADGFIVSEDGNTFTGSGVEACRSSIIGTSVSPCAPIIVGTGLAIINGVAEAVSYDGEVLFSGPAVTLSGATDTVSEQVSFTENTVVCLIGTCPIPGFPNGGTVGSFGFNGEMGLWTISVFLNTSGDYQISSESYVIPGPPVSTPEPGMIVLLGIGLAGLALRRRLA